MEWMEELIWSLQQNKDYQAALQQLRELEDDYTLLRASLDENARELLDNYIAICEEIDDILCAAAYALGKQHGKTE